MKRLLLHLNLFWSNTALQPNVQQTALAPLGRLLGAAARGTASHRWRGGMLRVTMAQTECNLTWGPLPSAAGSHSPPRPVGADGHGTSMEVAFVLSKVVVNIQ